MQSCWTERLFYLSFSAVCVFKTILWSYYWNTENNFTGSFFPMSNTPASAAPAVNGGFASFTPAQSAVPPASTEPSQTGGDKYSSLGDLFSTPVTTESNTTALSWGGSSSNSAVNWSGGGGTSTSAGGIDWNSTGSSGSGMNWTSGGTSSTMGMTSNWNSSSGANNSMAPSNSGLWIWKITLLEKTIMIKKLYFISKPFLKTQLDILNMVIHCIQIQLIWLKKKIIPVEFLIILWNLRLEDNEKIRFTVTFQLCV